MPIIATRESEHEFENPPADTYVGVCYRVVDLGTQQIEWQGETKHQRKVMISWELDAKMSDGQPFTMHKRYTLSLHEKANMCKDLEAWRGRPFTDDEAKGFDIGNVLGAPCMMQIVHNTDKGKTYANINSLMKYKGDTPALVNEKMYFSLGPGDFDAEKFGKLSKNLQETIAKSPEYAEATKPKQPEKAEAVIDAESNPALNDFYNDLIPF